MTKMPPDWETVYREKCARLERELKECRHNAALVVHALDCAVQWGEAMMMYMTEETPMHPGVKGCKEALDLAMRAIKGRP